MNTWNIPKCLEREIKDRDKTCVYCGIELGSTGTRKSTATWEHIVNDARLVTRDNIARCCAPCNASKGTKTLVDWLESDYCKKRGITRETVALVVMKALSDVIPKTDSPTSKRGMIRKRLGRGR